MQGTVKDKAFIKNDGCFLTHKLLSSPGIFGLLAVSYMSSAHSSIL